VALGSLISTKEPASNGQAYQPLLLAEFTFNDGTVLRASTHNLSSGEGGTQYASHDYLARIDAQDIAAVQARSSTGIDRISDVAIHLYNADGWVYDTWEAAAGKGFKGAILKLALVMMDIDPSTGGYIFTNDSPAPVKFLGICDAPQCENGGQMLVVRATTAHNLARVVYPTIPCQQRCVNPFPNNAVQRAAGAGDMSSWFYGCGYCPDQSVTDPVTGLSATRGNTTTFNLTDAQGNPLTDGAGNYVQCGQTKTECQARGMWDSDSSARITRRYTGVQWAPSSTSRYSQSRKYGGNSVNVFSSRNDSIYARNYPYVSGQQWLKQPIVANILGDANSTRFEVVIDCGDISDATATSANGYWAPILNATNATPIVIQVDAVIFPSTSGTQVSIAGCKGNTAANGVWTVTHIDSTHFSLNGSAGNAYFVPAHNVAQVVVNGVIIPRLGDSYTASPAFTGGATFTHYLASEIFRWQVISNGARTGGFTGDTPWLGNGDPYGSLAMLEVVVYAELAQSMSAPDIKVLMTGHRIKTPTTATCSLADQLSWPYVQTTLPPWLLLDLLIEGNYTYSEIDLQSFIDAANFCGLYLGGNAVSYVALDATTRTHNRFIAEVALDTKQGGQETIQALLRSFNGQLVPNSETGLLSLFIRRTLADQQPQSAGAILGSNYPTLVKSIHVDGSAGNGYVAYLIDESVIQHDGRGVPKVRGPYSNPTAQSPNRITFPFQDADNAYADDSITVSDTVDIARAGGYQNGGQQIPQQLAVLGISNFDQGIRCCNVNLAEANRFNENRDSRGTRRWDVEATSRLEHLKVGQIVLFRYQSINAAGSPAGLRPLTLLESPPATPIPGILARVEQIKPVTNYERVTVTLAMHEDYVYTDIYGQHAAPPLSDPGQVLNRPPFPWDPYGEQPTTNILHDATEWGFQLAQTYDTAADGSPLANLAIGGCAPVNVFGSGQPPIFQTVQASQAPSGGTIRGGQRIYAAISVRDANNRWSMLSQPCYADLVPGTANTFTTPTISWQGSPTAWVLYAGTSDQTWSAQLAHGLGSLVGTGTPATITIDGLSVQTFGAPDPLCDSLLFQTKAIIHGGDWGDVCAAPTTNTLNFPGCAATTNQFVHQVLSLYANPQGSAVNVPIADFAVTANTATAFTVTPDPVAAGITAGMVFVMRSKYSATSTVLTNANFANSYNANAGLTAGAEVGNLVRILSGSGLGQLPRQITANTSTTLTVDPPYEILIDLDTIAVIEEPKWHPGQPAKQLTSKPNPTPSTVATVSIDNYLQKSILVEALVADPQGNTSLERFSPLREVYVWGAQGTRTIVGSASLTTDTQKLTDGLVLCDTTNIVGSTTTLSAAISSTGTTSISVTSGANIVNGTYIQIGSEAMLVSAGAPTSSLTVVRGQLGTTAATASNGATVNVPGALFYHLLPIASLPNRGLIVKKTSVDLNYVQIVADTTAPDTFDGGAPSLYLADTTVSRGVASLKAPGA
jgi:hypothetical protein